MSSMIGKVKRVSFSFKSTHTASSVRLPVSKLISARPLPLLGMISVASSPTLYLSLSLLKLSIAAWSGSSRRERPSHPGQSM